jgi:hypothetical protein
MKQSLLRKAERIAKDRASTPRVRMFWWGLDEPHEAVDARIRASIASGETSPNDRYAIFSWRRPEE